ncbi:MAG: hypothetical protein D6732_03200 [Methanobacteriota archaeon]|nr:MAG: hypothetical protein D6732_03200 [Euryarchaeota archaeon]
MVLGTMTMRRLKLENWELLVRWLVYLFALLGILCWLIMSHLLMSERGIIAINVDDDARAFCNENGIVLYQ